MATLPVPPSLPLTANHWSPDGTALAALSPGELQILTLRDGSLRSLPVAVGEPLFLAWHPDASAVVAIGEGAAVLVQLADGAVTPLGGLDGASSRYALMGGWSPDGERLLVARDEGQGWLWTRSGELLAEPERDRNVIVAWHPSGDRFLLSGSPWETTATVFDRDGTLIFERAGVALTPWAPATDRWLASVDKQAHLADAASGDRITPVVSANPIYRGTWGGIRRSPGASTPARSG